MVPTPKGPWALSLPVPCSAEILGEHEEVPVASAWRGHSGLVTLTSQDLEPKRMNRPPTTTPGGVALQLKQVHPSGGASLCPTRPASCSAGGLNAENWCSSQRRLGQGRGEGGTEGAQF